MNLARLIARIFRGNLLHMAIGARGSLRRVVKRPRALAGNAAGLPVVVIIEAAHPPVIVYWNIEMDLMAGRAKLRVVFPHERLHESVAMRLRIQERQEIVHLPDEF